MKYSDCIFFSLTKTTISMKTSIRLRNLIASFLCVLSLTFAARAFAGDPIPGVDVHLQPKGGTALSSKTDAEGAFSFEKLPAGTYTLWISQDQCARAINTKGTGAVARQNSSSTSDHQFGVVCDDGNDIVVAALHDSDGNGGLDREPAKGQTVGKRRMHKPFVITKEWSASSPGLQITISGSGKKDFKGHVTLLK
jgi:hypothetical protein